MLSAGEDTVGAVYCSRWPGLALPVEDGHPPAIRDVCHQAQPLRGPPAVEPALGEVPAGRDEENIVQAR